MHVRLSRIECSEHGIKQIIWGLGDEKSSITCEFEDFVIDLQRECSIESVCQLLDMGWQTSSEVMEGAVVRGQARKPHRIAEQIVVDEKSSPKGHKY